jgi:hypothetical protein
MAGRRKLEVGGITYKPSCDFAVDDYQQETLEQLLLKYADEILGAGPPDEARRFVRLTESSTAKHSRLSWTYGGGALSGR